MAYYNMYDMMGYGAGFFGWIYMILGLVVLILLIMWLAKQLNK